MIVMASPSHLYTHTHIPCPPSHPFPPIHAHRPFYFRTCIRTPTTRLRIPEYNQVRLLTITELRYLDYRRVSFPVSPEEEQEHFDNFFEVRTRQKLTLFC